MESFRFVTGIPSVGRCTVTPGAFGGSISVGTVEFSKTLLLSMLQKGIRRQSLKLALQAANLYLFMADKFPDKLHKAALTNFFNRLVIIACEDCSAAPRCAVAALLLHKKYSQVAESNTAVEMKEIVRVLSCMCTSGTSRLVSFARSELYKATPEGKWPIVSDVASVDQLVKAMANVGSIDNAKAFYQAVDKLCDEMKKSAPHAADNIRMLVYFVKKTKGNSVTSTVKVDGIPEKKRNGDHDMLLRIIVQWCMQTSSINFNLSLDTLEKFKGIKYDVTMSPPVFAMDQHCMRPMKKHPEKDKYFAVMASACDAVILGKDPAYQRIHRAYLKTKGVDEKTIDAIITFEARESIDPPYMPHPIYGDRAHPWFTRFSKQTEEHSKKRTFFECTADAKFFENMKKQPKTEPQPEPQPFNINDFMTVVPYKAFRTGAMWRFHCGLLRGTKPPSFFFRDSAENLCWAKLFKTVEERDYAFDANRLINTLELPHPDESFATELEMNEYVLEKINDPDADRQLASWKRHFVGNKPALVQSVIGLPSCFRQLKLEDMKNERMLKQVVKILIVRRLIGCSDACTANIRVFDSNVYSIDHNKHAQSTPEFIPARFSGDMRTLIEQELAANKDEYTAFLAEVKRVSNMPVDNEFSVF